MLEDLKAMGADVDDAIKRLQGNRDLYISLLHKFPNNASKYNAVIDFQENDWENAFIKAHTMKGVTANLSLTPLYNSYCNVVELLRENKQEEARKAYEELLLQEESFIRILI